MYMYSTALMEMKDTYKFVKSLPNSLAQRTIKVAGVARIDYWLPSFRVRAKCQSQDTYASGTKQNL